MTRVCLLGDPDLDLQYELLSRETSREALSTYDLERPYENALAVQTVSLGAAVSLLNDLQWYLTRFVDEALVREPSVDEDEWLSRALAERLRNGEIDPEDTGEFCKIYGVETTAGETLGDEGDDGGDATRAPNETDGEPSDADSAPGRFPTRRLVEPLYVRRTDGGLPEYDLRDVDETLVVRVTEGEFR